MWLSGNDCSSDFDPVSLVLWRGFLQEHETKIVLSILSCVARVASAYLCVNARQSQTRAVASVSESIRLLQQKNMEIRRETDEE